jgi:hypothetical protein
LFGLTHQRHKDTTLAATAAAKATHHLGEGVLQVVDLAVEWCGPAAALLGDMVDERKRFFCALYRWSHP